MLSLAALAGSVAGCVLCAALAAGGHAPPAPLTTSRMSIVASAQVAQEGVAALHHQPWSGIPVKVYAAAEGRHHAPPVSLALAVGVARGSRLLVVAVVLATIARLIPRRAFVPVATFAVATFAAGLHQVVAHWS